MYLPAHSQINIPGHIPSIRAHAKIVLTDIEVVASTGKMELHNMFGLAFSTRFSGIIIITNVDNNKTATAKNIKLNLIL